MFRATAMLADITYRYSHTTYHPCEQTLGYWEYLDRDAGRHRLLRLHEEEIGELYVGYRAEPAARRRPRRCRPYLEAIERHGLGAPGQRAGAASCGPGTTPGSACTTPD